MPRVGVRAADEPSAHALATPIAVTDRSHLLIAQSQRTGLAGVSSTTAFVTASRDKKPYSLCGIHERAPV